MPNLKCPTLTTPSDSITIGPSHREILREKLEEFNKVLSERKHQLEQEYRELIKGNLAGKPSGTSSQLERKHQLEQEYRELIKGNLAGKPSGTSSQLERKHQLEQEYRELIKGNLAGKPSGTSSQPMDEGHKDFQENFRQHQQREVDLMRHSYQRRLDQLLTKFQKEWAQDPQEKKVNFELPKSDTESAYLGEKLGDALGRGLAEICEKRPIDPIEYLALWLRKYAENLKEEQERAVHGLKVRLCEEEEEMLQENEELMTRERLHIKMEEDRRRKIFLEQAKQIEPDLDTSPASLNSADTKSADAEGKTPAAQKRVTVVDPENPNALYTIEEKDSEVGSGNFEDD